MMQYSKQFIFVSGADAREAIRLTIICSTQYLVWKEVCEADTIAIFFNSAFHLGTCGIMDDKWHIYA